MVWKLKAALDRTSQHMEEACGVSGLQRFLLRFVGLAPGISAHGLAEAIATEPERLQGELDQLVARNFLADRRESPGYYLTAQGARINAAMVGTVEEAVSKAADEASAYERASFRRMLERLIVHLR